MSSSWGSKNSTIIIKDEDGNITFEGVVLSYTISIGSRTGKRISVEAADPIYHIGVPSAIEFVPININIDDIGVTAAKCTHKWKLYQGLQEKYNYCEVCGVKQ